MTRDTEVPAAKGGTYGVGFGESHRRFWVYHRPAPGELGVIVSNPIESWGAAVADRDRRAGQRPREGVLVAAGGPNGAI